MKKVKLSKTQVKHKSSTLSLHTMTIEHEDEEEDSPLLQRRNSIHNVRLKLKFTIHNSQCKIEVKMFKIRSYLISLNGSNLFFAIVFLLSSLLNILDAL